MSSLTVTVARGLEPPWTHMAAVVLGSGAGPAEAHVLVRRDGEAILRLDLRHDGFDEYVHKTQATVWRDLIAVGHGERVYLLRPDGGDPVRHRLTVYFCGFEAVGDEALLAATGDDIIRLGADGAIVWRSPPLGVDGVIIHEVEQGVIRGDGEWDPPGGWRPFAIRLADGQFAEAG